MASTPPKETRRYDSPVRREQVAETHERIIDAGAQLVHELSSWDWQGLTVRAVASRAGVHERTVHRHFATERDLRAAVLQRLLEESGVTVEGMQLEDLPAHVAQLFGYLASFSSSTARRPDGVLQSLDDRRKAALLATVSDAAADFSDADRTLIASLIDVLWGVPTFTRLITGWGLDADEATRGVNWILQLVTDAVRSGHAPGDLQ